MGQPVSVSLFEMAKAAIGDVETMMCSKVTLVHLSHTLEDIVLKNQLKAMMFTGFQESSHWVQETERYSEIAKTAQQVCIFAGKPLPEDAAMGALQVELAVDDPLRQEWFVIILSEEFNVILTGRDNLGVSDQTHDSWRTFETIISFDTTVINPVLDQLEIVVKRYSPEIFPSLQTARQQFKIGLTHSDYFNDIITDFVGFEERLNQKLRYESELNQQMIASIQDFTIIVDKTLRIISVNPAFIASIQGQLDDVLGAHLFTYGLSDKAQSAMQQAIQMTLETGEPRTLSTAFSIEDDIRQIDWHLSVIYLSTKSDTIFLTGHDVTARVLLEQASLEEAQLRAVLEQERELNGLRSRFIRTVSHEFRTPLTSILNSAEMLESHFDELGVEGRKRRLDRIRDQVLNITDMVEEISIAMAASKGNLKYSPIPCHINEIMGDVLDSIRTNIDDETRLRFVTTIEDDHIIADPRLLRLIVSNLVTNALKYSPKTQPVDVKLSIAKERLIVTVQDQGDGIPQHDQKYIFDAFYRGDNVSAVSGTGMGLRIVQDCIRIYEGKIDFHSDENGTTFTIRLPIPDIASI